MRHGRRSSPRTRCRRHPICAGRTRAPRKPGRAESLWNRASARQAAHGKLLRTASLRLACVGGRRFQCSKTRRTWQTLLVMQPACESWRDMLRRRSFAPAAHRMDNVEWETGRDKPILHQNFAEGMDLATPLQSRTPGGARLDWFLSRSSRGQTRQPFQP